MDFAKQLGKVVDSILEIQGYTVESVCLVLLFEMQTFRKCPTFPQPLQVASRAGHFALGCLSNPQK